MPNCYRFQDFTLDLLLAINNELPLEDAKSLRLTCKDFADIFALRVLRKVTIKFNSRRHANEVSKLCILSSGKSYASRFTRELDLDSLSPRRMAYHKFDPDSREPTLTEADLPAVESDIQKYLPDALNSLQGLTKIKWRYFPSDDLGEQWALPIIMRFYASQKNLRDLNIKTHPSIVDFPVSALLNLERLSLLWLGPKENAIFDAVSEHISEMKQLRSLRIGCNGSPSERPRHDALQDLLRHYPAAKNGIPLTHLTLNHTIPRLDETTLPHFQHLTSLEINGADIRREDGSQDLSFVPLLEEFWASLKNASIWLESIVVEQPVPGFFDYIESYSGLKRLKIETHLLDKKVSEAAASRFFSTSIAHHFSSLESVHIYTTFSGLWVFDSINAHAYSQCKNLRDVLIPVETSTEALDLVVTTFASLPRFELFSLEYVIPDDFRGLLCGMPYESCRVQSLRALRSYFREYCSSSRPPSIMVKKDTFVPVFDSDSKSWKYTGKRLASTFDETWRGRR